MCWETEAPAGHKPTVELVCVCERERDGVWVWEMAVTNSTLKLSPDK